ncbi:MAG TPA: phage major capsid protein [Sedimentisphaerales bacterium]|nr:phage major capsid protein [Sedimentisphaerales bacterium]
MDPKLKILFDKRTHFVQQRKALLDKVIGEERLLTEEEQAENTRLAAEIDKMDNLIAYARSIPDDPTPGPAGPDPQPSAPEIHSFGELLFLVRFAPHDERLRELADGKEHRDMSMGVGSAGGFLVPEQMGPLLEPIQPQEAVFRPRARVIPAGTPPDAAITLPALDQGGAHGVYGGVQVVWIAEAVTKPETEPELREIKLEPQEVAGHVVASDKLLRNTAAAGALISTLLRGAINAAEDQAFLNGTGIGQPLGIIGHPASINVVRAGAGAIAYADVVNMFAQALMGGGRQIWIGSQTILPQLMQMATPLGQLVWQPSAREGMPMSLMGIPLILNARSPVLGAQGDLILADLNYYLIKDGSPLTIAASEHPRFTRNQTIIKGFWNVDGQPWLNSPLLLEDGVTQVSPFVVLQ